MNGFDWHCGLHNVTGAGNDTSLSDHQDDEHGGAHITVLIIPVTRP